MRSDITEKIDVPSGVTVSITPPIVTIKGKKGEVSRIMNDRRVLITLENNAVVLKASKATKREKTSLYTSAAHLKNMIAGAASGYLYEMKICAAHFPMTVTVSNNQLIIKNFIGEHTPRTLNLRKGVAIKVNGDILQIESADKELAGSTASDIELLTRIRDHDRRVFQDGIFLTSKKVLS